LAAFTSPAPCILDEPNGLIGGKEEGDVADGINPFEANDYPSGIEKLSVWFPITGGPPETELFLTCLYFMFDLDS